MLVGLGETEEYHFQHFGLAAEFVVALLGACEHAHLQDRHKIKITEWLERLFKNEGIQQ